MFRLALCSRGSFFQVVIARLVLVNFLSGVIRSFPRVGLSMPVHVQLYVGSTTLKVMLIGRVRGVVRLIIERLLFRLLQRVVLSMLSNLFVVSVVLRGVIFRSRACCYLGNWYC